MRSHETLIHLRGVGEFLGGNSRKGVSLELWDLCCENFSWADIFPEKSPKDLLVECLTRFSGEGLLFSNFWIATSISFSWISKLSGLLWLSNKFEFETTTSWFKSCLGYTSRWATSAKIGEFKFISSGLSTMIASPCD